MLWSFVLGVAASLVATAVAICVSFLTSSSIRWRLMRLFARASGLGPLSTFDSQSAARKSLQLALSRASWVKVFTARGNELVEGPFEALYARALTLSSIEIVLLDASTDAQTWARHHDEEARAYDAGFGEGLLQTQVMANLKYLRERTSELPNVELKVADFPSVARLVMTDTVAFITLYSTQRHGRSSSCVQAPVGTELYSFAARMFGMISRVSRPVSSAKGFLQSSLAGGEVNDGDSDRVAG